MDGWMIWLDIHVAGGGWKIEGGNRVMLELVGGCNRVVLERLCGVGDPIREG